jgi:hypothetical protein
VISLDDTGLPLITLHTVESRLDVLPQAFSTTYMERGDHTGTDGVRQAMTDALRTDLDELKTTPLLSELELVEVRQMPTCFVKCPLACKCSP